MANAIVRLPLGYFPDPNKGKPLFNAKIYVGLVDLDPRIPANQVQVTGRQESGNEIPLAQPIRTSKGGIPVDVSGNYVTLLVDGAYSMAVDDRNDNQKYYFANVLDGAPLTFSDLPILYRPTLTVALADADLTTGLSVITGGNTIENGGGSAQYIVTAGVGTVNGISIIDKTDASGLQFNKIETGIVRLEQGAGLTQTDIDNAIAYANSTNQSLDVTASSATITISVPSVILTLQEAADFAYKCITNSGQVLDVLMDTGFSPTSGILVSSEDYSNISISSVDSEVSLDASFTLDFIKGTNSIMPTLNCLVNAGGFCENGYYAESASKGTVNINCGVKFAGFHGLYANSSSNVNASGTIFTDCSQTNPLYSGILSWGSKVDAFGADVSRSLYYGAQSAASGTLYFRDGIADDCARHNIRATNGALTIARGASAKNGGVSGVRSFDLGMVHATDVDVTGSAVGIWCENGSVVNAENAIGDNCVGSFIFCNDSSKVNATGATAADVGAAGISCQNLSEVNVNASTISCVDNQVINAASGSTVSAIGSTLSHGGTVELFDISDGATVIANSAITSNPLGRCATVFDGSTFRFKDGTATYSGIDGINCSGGSICTINGSNIPSADVTGMLFNTLYARGICWG